MRHKQVSRKKTETTKQTPIKIMTLLVLDKLNLIDYKLGVGIVETIRKETIRTHKITNPTVNS